MKIPYQVIRQARKRIRKMALQKVRRSHEAKAMRIIRKFDEKLGLLTYGREG